MNSDLAGDKRRWIASVGGAVVVTAIFFVLLRVPRPPAPVPDPPAKPKPGILVAPAGFNRILDDEKVMRDQTPLFLPTERNVAPRPPRRPEAGRTVLDQDVSRFSFSEAELALNLPQPERVAEKPADVVLSAPAASPLYGFGRRQAATVRLPERGGFVEIMDSRANKRVFAETLAVESGPPTDKPWRPLEYLAAVDAAGLVGSLLITQRSDVDEVDAYFRKYLVQTFRIGERLPPGFYRVVVGP